MIINNFAPTSFLGARRNTNLKDKNNNPLYYKDGLIVDEQDKPFNDKAYGRNNEGENICKLEYDDGKIYKAVDFVHGKIKTYRRNKPLKSSNCNQIELKDGSKILDINYYQYPQKATFIDTVKYDGENEREFCSIYKNPEAKYKGEKTFECVSHNGKTFAIKKQDGIDREEHLSSTDEAQEFIQEKYGVKVDKLRDLKEGLLIIEALETFAKLNYQGKGDKLFDGLEIKHEEIYEDEEKTIPDKDTVAQLDWNEPLVFYKIINFANACEKISPDLSRKILPDRYFIKEDLAPCIKINTLNPLNIDEEKSLLDGYSGHTHYLIKSQLVHELAHILHIDSLSAKDLFITNNEKFNKHKKDIASKVGKYATTDPVEFVAEYAAARLEGMQYDDEVNELYKKYKGPNLFNE